MAEDQPGPPGSNQGDRPGQRPTEPIGGPTQPPAPPPSSGQPGSELRSPAPTAPLPGAPSAPPAFAAVGSPREALAGFWRRLVAAFLDWLLVGIVAAAIGDLFGVQAQRRPRPTGASTFSSRELARSFWSSWPTHLLPRHQRRPVDRQQDSRYPRTGRQHRPVSALRPGVRPCPHEQPLCPPVLPWGSSGCLGNPVSGPGTTWLPTAWSSGRPSTRPASSAAPHTKQPRRGVQRPPRVVTRLAVRGCAAGGMQVDFGVELQDAPAHRTN
jgi:hypothetical protein